MNQFPIGGRSSSGLQEVPQLYSPATQLQFPLPLGSQQVPQAPRQTVLYSLSEPPPTPWARTDKAPSMPTLLRHSCLAGHLLCLNLAVRNWAGVGDCALYCLPLFSLCCLAPPLPVKCPPAGLYSSPFAARSSYPQAHMAVHSSQEPHPKHYPKPIYSYR